MYEIVTNCSYKLHNRLDCVLIPYKFDCILLNMSMNVGILKKSIRSGEYRSRTDDLLNANQAL